MRGLVGKTLRLGGWLLLAYLMGVLLAAPIRNPWLGLVVGSGGVLIAVFSVPRLQERLQFVCDRPLLASMLLAVLAVLFAVNRNTPLGFLPVSWIATVLASVVLILSLVRLIRDRSGSSI